MTDLPLQGTRILDLTRLLPGNYCTLLLADLGADVVKVEEPSGGDYIRWIPPLVDGQGAIHRALNRDKLSVTLNLKAPEGLDLLRRLARHADALVESFRPGVMERLGAGYEVLSKDHPRLVYCAITGYGQDGPYRERAGHDINYIGYAGLLGATGSPGGPPVLPSVQVGDFGGGMAAALSMAASLADARSTGRGRMVDVSMLDVVTSWLGVPIGSYLATGEPQARGAMRLSGGLACYRVYRTADHKHLAVGALEPQFWATLCQALEVPELLGKQYSPNQEEVATRLQEVFAKRTRDQWVADLAGLEACVGPVNDVWEAVEDPQVRHRGLVAEVAGEPVGPGPAIRFPDARRGPHRPAPGLGQNTTDVLASVGVSPEEVSELRSRGVV